MNSVPAEAATALACQIQRGSWPREMRAMRMRLTSSAMTSA